MNRLRDYATRYTAPPALRRSILEAGTQSTPATSTWRLPLASRGAFAVAALASVAMLAGNVALLGAVPSKEDRVVADVTTGHVRSLLASRSVDVVSSDQHTVKPWFAGKLDFSPPADDFAERGFALLGGRLDYVDGERVAVLVYQHRKHLVDVFVSATPGRAGPATSRRGCNLVHWTRDGLSFWAVSDAEAESLEVLHTLFSSAAMQPE